MGPEFALNPEESDDANAFIQVDFGAEGNEYPGDGYGPTLATMATSARYSAANDVAADAR